VTTTAGASSQLGWSLTAKTRSNAGRPAISVTESPEPQRGRRGHLHSARKPRWLLAIPNAISQIEQLDRVRSEDGREPAGGEADEVRA